MFRIPRDQHHQSQLQQGRGHAHPLHRCRGDGRAAGRGGSGAQEDRIHTSGQRTAVCDVNGVHPARHPRIRHESAGTHHGIRFQHLLHLISGGRHGVSEVQNGTLCRRYEESVGFHLESIRIVHREHPRLQQLQRRLRQFDLLQLLRFSDLQEHEHLPREEGAAAGELQHGHADAGRYGIIAIPHIRFHRETC